MSLPRTLTDRLDLLPADILRFARAAAMLARKHHTSAVLVGGVVRDLLLKRPVVEADIMLEPPVQPVAEGLAASFSGKLIAHPRFQTFRVDLPDGRKFDLVTAREETYARPAALPDVKASTFGKDLARRDFSINAMICRLDPVPGELYDPLGGHADLDARIIRALHERSFSDDPTRIFRAARFAGRLDFKVEPRTADWIMEARAAGAPDKLSPVRRRHEVDLLLKEENPVPAFGLLGEWGMLRFIHPALDGVDLASAGLGDPIPGTERLAERWARLFRAVGATGAPAAMTALSFEKPLRRAVMDRLGGAR